MKKTDSTVSKDNSFFERKKNELKHFFSVPSNIILVVFGIFLTISVIIPLGMMVMNSLKLHTISEAKNVNEIWGTSLKSGKYTFLQWPSLLFNKEVKGYSANYFWIPFYKSVLMSLLACAIAVFFGGALAFLITRTDIPFKKFISTVFVFPYIMPSWSIANFWIDFFKNSSIAAAPGIGLLESLTGLQAPQWFVYGFWPSAFVLGIHYAPFAYILIGGILRNMDANLEEAATILKASRFKIIRRITLPIVAPAMLSTILLVFASSISSYTVPYFLNADGSFNSISITMKSAFSTGRWGEGYVISTILLALSVIILTINNNVTKSRRSFTTVSGKSGQISKINLKSAKWPIAVFMLVLVLFCAILPLVTFAISSLEDVQGDLSSLTLKWWISNEELIDDVFISSRDLSTKGLFFNKTILSSFGRSVLLAIVVSLFCGTCGILIGYAVSRNRKSKFANFVGSLAFLPYIIPALCFSSMFYSIMKKPAFNFLDYTITLKESSALAICFIVGAIKFLPFASRSGTNAMLQLSGEIEEAAIIVGAPWWKRMTRILFPIQKSSFMSGYLLPFISCMREYSLFALIAGPFTLATCVLEYYTRNGVGDQLASGLNLFLVLFVIGSNLLINKLTGASIDKGVGG